MQTKQPSRPLAVFLTGLLLASALTLSASCGRQTQTATATPTPQAAAPSASPIPWATIEPPNQAAATAGTPQPHDAAATSQFVFPKDGAAGKSYSGVGVVRLINFDEGWLEIDHEEIKGFMPAMQMEWTVKDRAMLKTVQVGDKVDFTVEDHNGTQFITGLKKASR